MGEYRPDRVVRALAALVSIAFFGLLVLAVVVLVGLPAVKLLAGENPEWSIGLPVPVVPLDADATVLTRWGDAQLDVEDMHGSLRVPVRMLPWWLFGVLWAYFAAAFALTLLFLHHLRRLLQRVRGGAPFAATNAWRLRRLGLLALAFAVVKGVAEAVTALGVSRGLVSDRLAVPRGIGLDGSMVIFGLVLLALAEIFRRGTELEEEQSLTV